jgi:hypothetical protein
MRTIFSENGSTGIHRVHKVNVFLVRNEITLKTVEAQRSSDLRPQTWNLKMCKILKNSLM